MPYSSLSDLPKSVKRLPKHAQEIYLAVFNNASDEYDTEALAHATAWSQVKKQYKKSDSGKWVKKKKTASLDQEARVILAYLNSKK